MATNEELKGEFLVRVEEEEAIDASTIGKHGRYLTHQKTLSTPIVPTEGKEGSHIESLLYKVSRLARVL